MLTLGLRLHRAEDGTVSVLEAGIGRKDLPWSMPFVGGNATIAKPSAGDLPELIKRAEPGAFRVIALVSDGLGFPVFACDDALSHEVEDAVNSDPNNRLTLIPIQRFGTAIHGPNDGDPIVYVMEQMLFAPGEMPIGEDPEGKLGAQLFATAPAGAGVRGRA